MILIFYKIDILEIILKGSIDFLDKYIENMRKK
jgi:hypothetical protein